MSMKTSIVYGFGFHPECKLSKFVEFMINHKDSFCESLQEKELFEELMKETENGKKMPENASMITDIFENYSCRQSGNEGYLASISNVMTRETSVRFAYWQADDNCDTDAAILFTESMPWNLSYIEKTLTQDDLAYFCQKYAAELGISEEPDFLEQKYYG